MEMLTYHNIEGKPEAVSKQTVVRFSAINDHVFNVMKEITVIHLSNKEKLHSIDKMGTLIQKMKSKK